MRTLFMAICLVGVTVVDNELIRLLFTLALGLAAYTQGLDDESERYTEVSDEEALALLNADEENK